MELARYPENDFDPRCSRCGHVNEANEDGSCPVIYNPEDDLGEVLIDFQCECKAHVLSIDKRRIKESRDEPNDGTNGDSE